MKNTFSRNEVDDLREIQEKMQDLIGRAEWILRSKGFIWERAKGYWYASIVTALNKDHGFLGGCMVTMEDTINEAESTVEEDCEEDEEDCEEDCERFDGCA